MSRNNDNPIGAIVFLILIASGAFAFIMSVLGHIMAFFLWLFTISMTEFGISLEAEVFVKIATFALSYGLVAIIFSFDDGFKGKDKAMGIAYLVISTLLGFGLSVVVMFLEQNIVIIFWMLISILIITLLSFGVYWKFKLKTKKNQKV
ncbi:MAG: hypothetical protein NUK62_06665 [Tenericutes bacterium]|nr:hypothetical protein [Mycoplasmatota bacterium]